MGTVGGGLAVVGGFVCFFLQQQYAHSQQVPHDARVSVQTPIITGPRSGGNCWMKSKAESELVESMAMRPNFGWHRAGRLLKMAAEVLALLSEWMEVTMCAMWTTLKRGISVWPGK